MLTRWRTPRPVETAQREELKERAVGYSAVVARGAEEDGRRRRVWRVGCPVCEGGEKGQSGIQDRRAPEVLTFRSSSTAVTVPSPSTHTSSPPSPAAR